MTYPIIENCFRVAFNYVGVSGGATNVMHFLNSTDSVAQIATDLDAKVTSAMWGHMPNTCKLDSIAITKLDGITGTYVLTGINQAGNTDGQPVPAVSALLYLQTGLIGRENRGRMFLPWVSEGAMASGILDGTVQANTASAWNTFRTQMDGVGSVLAVASYKFGAATPVLSLGVRSAVATQRRRQQRLQ